MKAKKSYGQHFLNKDEIAMKIANSLKLSDAYNSIVEVGPGMGVLSQFLLEYQSHSITCIEADRDMVQYLQQNEKFERLKIIQFDFLKFKLNEIADSFAVIGNFPYNISTQIVFKILDHRQNIPEMVGMFQKEVAERIASKEGSKKYGIISVLTQLFYDVEYLFTVGPENFNPPPKVQSGVIRLIRKEEKDLPSIDYGLFKSIVKISFGKRRKMLRNSLKAFFEKKEITNCSYMEKRPEALSVTDFIELCTLLQE